VTKPRLEFFFDCSSPWTYLAFHRVQDVIAETGARSATIRFAGFARPGGGHGDRDLVGRRLVGCVHRTSRIADHDAHQIDQRREQQLARVLVLRRLLEQRIDRRCRQRVLHHPARHHTDRTLCREPLENSPQQHSTTPVRGGINENLP